MSQFFASGGQSVVASTSASVLPMNIHDWFPLGLTGLMRLLSSVQFSGSVMSDSLQPHESQHAKAPCPSPTPRVHSNSCPSSQWCHPAISSSVVPFSSCLQSLPASRSFPMCQFFKSGGKFSFSISPSNEYSGLISFRMDWVDLLAADLLESPKDSQESSPTPQFKCINSSALSFLYSPTPASIHDYWKKS